jgi:hypothetical protein
MPVRALAKRAISEVLRACALPRHRLSGRAGTCCGCRSSGWAQAVTLRRQRVHHQNARMINWATTLKASLRGPDGTTTLPLIKLPHSIFRVPITVVMVQVHRHRPLGHLAALALRSSPESGFVRRQPAPRGAHAHPTVGAAPADEVEHSDG